MQKNEDIKQYQSQFIALLGSLSLYERGRDLRKIINRVLQPICLMLNPQLNLIHIDLKGNNPYWVQSVCKNFEKSNKLSLNHFIIHRY